MRSDLPVRRAAAAVLLSSAAWLPAASMAAQQENRLQPSAQLLQKRQAAIEKNIGANGKRTPEELTYALNLYEVSEAIDDLFALHPEERGGGQVAVLVRPDGTVADCEEFETPAPVTPGFKRDFCAYLSRLRFGLKTAQLEDGVLPIGIHKRGAPAPFPEGHKPGAER